tara:strand:+ start:3655 stop:5337 length:1683 start_codon:yes stop_codon:yes gene_type:complete
MKSKILILIAVVLLSASSCEDFLKEEPKSLLSSSTIFTTEDGLVAGILGVYDGLMGFYTWEASGAMYLGTDEGCTKWGSSFRADFDSYSWSTESYYLAHFWHNHYTIIMRANLLIRDAPESSIEPEVVDRIVAEAKFLRALAYFRLVQLWGPVPITLGSEAEELPREPVGKVYALIVQDLIDATQPGVLPVEKSASHAGRVTHYAAKTLLGRVYLTMASYKKYGTTFEGLMSEAGKSDYGYQTSLTESTIELYGKAEVVLKDIIDNGPYELLDNYADIFVIENKNLNPESIFEVQFSEEKGAGWSKDLGYPCWPPFGTDLTSWAGHTNNKGIPSLVLFYAQEGDQRLEYNMPSNYIDLWSSNPAERFFVERTDEPDDPSNYMNMVNNNGNFYAYGGFGKYRWGPEPFVSHGYAGGQDVPTNGIMMRYADVLLMYAEASLEANGGATQDGLDAVNQIRNRARGFNIAPSQTPEFPNLTLSELTLDEIMDERVRELCIEHYRKFDLLRTNKLQEAILTRKPTNDPNMTGPITIDDSKWLYPIPQTEIDIVVDKGLLWQNPGY